MSKRRRYVRGLSKMNHFLFDQQIIREIYSVLLSILTAALAAKKKTIKCFMPSWFQLGSQKLHPLHSLFCFLGDIFMDLYKCLYGRYFIPVFCSIYKICYNSRPNLFEGIYEYSPNPFMTSLIVYIIFLICVLDIAYNYIGRQIQPFSHVFPVSFLATTAEAWCRKLY